MFHRKLYLNFNIFFMKQLQDLANEFPNLVCYVYYWTLLGVKRAGGPSSPNMMGTLESAHSSWNCANIYKLVRQYFAPCLFNQRAFVAIFLLIYAKTNAKLSSKTGQEILVSFWRKDVGHICIWSSPLYIVKLFIVHCTFGQMKLHSTYGYIQCSKSKFH